MNLIGYSIKNYKSIKEGKFDATRTTVIIGRNNSGKSNIINSLKDFPPLYHVASHRRSERLPENWFESTVTGKDITKKLYMNSNSNYRIASTQMYLAKSKEA